MQQDTIMPPQMVLAVSGVPFTRHALSLHRLLGLDWMLRHIWIGLIVMAAAATAEADPPIRVRILSYNIHHAEGIDGRLDLNRVANVIRDADPDIVALQEVDSKARRSGSVDQAAELARLTEMHFTFGANIPLQGGNYGNAILSKFPILASTNHLLPRLRDGEQRGVLQASLQVDSLGKPLTLFATHFDHRGPDDERLKSAEQINRLAGDLRDGPALLAGDMNDTPGSDTLKRLESSWVRTNHRPLATIPVKEPRRQIDFVFFRPRDQWRVIETTVIDETVASDHRPILAVLDLLRTKQR